MGGERELGRRGGEEGNADGYQGREGEAEKTQSENENQSRGISVTSWRPGTREYVVSFFGSDPSLDSYQRGIERLK